MFWQISKRQMKAKDYDESKKNYITLLLLLWIMSVIPHNVDNDYLLTVSVIVHCFKLGR